MQAEHTCRGQGCLFKIIQVIIIRHGWHQAGLAESQSACRGGGAYLGVNSRAHTVIHFPASRHLQGLGKRAGTHGYLSRRKGYSNLVHLGLAAAKGLSAAMHMQGLAEQLHLILNAEADGKCNKAQQRIRGSRATQAAGCSARPALVRAFVPGLKRRQHALQPWQHAISSLRQGAAAAHSWAGVPVRAAVEG